MNEFSEPSVDLAERVLAEVDFEDRIVGYSLRKRMGPVPITLYSFEEVVGFLSDGLPQMDFNELEKWIKETMKDNEPYKKINLVSGSDLSDLEKAAKIRDLMGIRLVQCRRVLAI